MEAAEVRCEEGGEGYEDGEGALCCTKRRLIFFFGQVVGWFGFCLDVQCAA